MAEELQLAGTDTGTGPFVSTYNRDDGYLIESIVPWARNPRKRFDQVELEQLADSIKAVGVQQPIGVRFLPGAASTDVPRFQIVFGERRFRAAKMAGRTRIPANYLGELSDFDALERAYRENHDREDVSPIEEARSYEQMLAEPPGMSQIALAEKLRIGQGTVSNALRLLKLPDTIIDRVDHGQISKSTATALCGVLDHPAKFAELVLGIDSGWASGRIEEEVRQFKSQIAEQKRQTEVAAKPQLPFEETAATPVEDSASAAPETEEEAPDSVASTGPVADLALESGDVGEGGDFDGDGPETYADTLTDADLAESNLADGDESEYGGEEKNYIASDDAGAAVEQNDGASLTAPTAPASYPLPSASTGLTAKNVTPGAATPKPTTPAAPAPAPATPAASTPVAVPSSGAPDMSSLPAPAPDHKWVQMRIEDDDALFMDLDLNDLDQAMHILRTYYPNRMSRKLLKALADAERAALPHAEPMTYEQLLQHILTNTARMRGIDTDTIQELPE